MESYSLWLVATDKAERYLQSVVDDLAKEHGTVSFQPHVTLISDVKGEPEVLVKKAEELAKYTAHFWLETGAIDASTTYFQCVFTRIETDPELLDLYINSAETFGITSPPFFMPHVSLLYSDFDFAKRVTIARQLQVEKTVFIPELQLIKSDPDPQKWEVIERFSLI